MLCHREVTPESYLVTCLVPSIGKINKTLMRIWVITVVPSLLLSSRKAVRMAACAADAEGG